MPLDDQIRHRHLVALEWMTGRELLQRDSAAELFKVGLEVFLLATHSLGAGNSRADGADVLEIAVSPLAVDGNVGELELAAGWPLPSERARVPNRQRNERCGDKPAQHGIGPGERRRAA